MHVYMFSNFLQKMRSWDQIENYKNIKFIKDPPLHLQKPQKQALQKERTYLGSKRHLWQFEGVGFFQFIIISMEHNRRNLRNYNKCQQINNIFNIKTSQSHVTSHLPPQILTQIGKLQKISCCNINNLPQLRPQYSFQQGLEKCRAVQQVQSPLPHRSPEKNQLDSVPDNKETTQKEKVVSVNSLFCKEQQKSEEQGCLHEKDQLHYGIWKDAQLVDKLNDFFMLGDNGKLSINYQLFQK